MNTSAMWFNMFPSTNGIYTTVIPINLVKELQKNYKKCFWIKSRSYAQTYEEYDNWMGSRMIGDIALQENGNS